MSTTVISILNSVHPIKGFCYADSHFDESSKILRVLIRPRSNGIVHCPCCDKRGAVYDTSREARETRFLDIFPGVQVFFKYFVRRVYCRHCGAIKTETLPWVEGKSHSTMVFSDYLAHWAKTLPIREVADVFHTTWNRVYEAIDAAVRHGLKEREIKDVTAIGIDEVQFQKGSNFMTLVYDVSGEKKRLLTVVRDRDEESLRSGIQKLGQEFAAGVECACTDMWKPYMNVVKEELPHAMNILDRFHIVRKCNEAVDNVRKKELSELYHEDPSGKGYQALKGAKYSLLKRPENLTEGQNLKLSEVLKRCSKSTRAYRLKEEFGYFWEFSIPEQAAWYLRKWGTRAKLSRLEPMKQFVEMLRRHEELVMNWFKAGKGYSSGAVEGLNRKVNLITRKSYGFKSFEILKTMLYHTLGNLPERKFTHRFW